MGLRIRIRAHLSRKVKRRALKLMDIETKVQQNGDNLLSIKASADAELMAGVEKAYGIVVDAIRTYQAEK